MIERLLLAVAAVVALGACGTATATGTDPLPSGKVFVCKYETTPGGGERLQTGQNPISVSISALPAGVTPAVGVEFNDAQGRSLVIAFDIGQPEPDVSVCPPPNGGTTTTSSSTTSSSSSTSSTTTCPDCVPNTQGVTTTSSAATTTAPVTTPATTTTSAATTTTSAVQATTTTLAPPGVVPSTQPGALQFSGASTICIAEVPTIRITFGNALPELAGRVGVLTMTSVGPEGQVASVQELVYAPGTTVDLLYPGTRVNADGSIADVPGWNLNAAGFWVRDPSDSFLRDGIVLTFTVNPTATATVTYPPESSTCANPDGPFPPGVTPPVVVVAPPAGSPAPLPPTRC